MDLYFSLWDESEGFGKCSIWCTRLYHSVDGMSNIQLLEATANPAQSNFRKCTTPPKNNIFSNFLDVYKWFVGEPSKQRSCILIWWNILLDVSDCSSEMNNHITASSQLSCENETGSVCWEFQKEQRNLTFLWRVFLTANSVIAIRLSLILTSL